MVTAPTRRRLLASMGMATISLAGCTISDGDVSPTVTKDQDGGTDDSESADENGATTTPLAEVGGLVDALEWLVPYEALGYNRPYFPAVSYPVAIARRGGVFDCDFGLENIRPPFPTLGDALSIEDVRMVVRMRDAQVSPPEHVSVATGSFDLSGALSADYDRIGEHRGFVRYRSTGRDEHVLAVRDGAAIYANVRDAIVAVDAVVDAREGNGNRMVDAHPSVGRVADTLGDVTVGRVFPIPESSSAYEDGWRALGRGVILGEATTTYRSALSFASPGDVNTDRLVGERGELEPSGEEWGNSEASTSGRIVTVDATADTADIQRYFIGPVPLGNPRHTQWQVSYEGSILSVTHQGGDPIQAKALVIEYDGTQRRADWNEALVAGDTVEFEAPDLSSGDSVRVLWDPPCATSSPLELAQHTIE